MGRVSARSVKVQRARLGLSAKDFGKIVASETEKWKKVVEFSGATVE